MQLFPGDETNIEGAGGEGGGGTMFEAKFHNPFAKEKDQYDFDGRRLFLRQRVG